MIGRALDRLIDNCIIGVGYWAHNFLTKLAPADPVRPSWMDENPLVEAEAAQEVWEPDELWAATNIKRPFEDTDDFSRCVCGSEVPTFSDGCAACLNDLSHPAGVVSPPTDTSRATNHIAAVKRILDDRLDAAEVEPFDKWLTVTAVEILNAVQK